MAKMLPVTQALACSSRQPEEQVLSASINHYTDDLLLSVALGVNNNDKGRFYSDLRPVLADETPRLSPVTLLRYRSTTAIPDHWCRRQPCAAGSVDGEWSEVAVMLHSDADSLDRRHNFLFEANVRFAFGLGLKLRLTEEEVRRLIAVTELPLLRLHLTNDGGAREQATKSSSAFFVKLPPEIRSIIYYHVLEGQRQRLPSWHIASGSPDLLVGLGDPSGFYQALPPPREGLGLDMSLGLLLVSRQMRAEALPLAYRALRTVRVDGLDDLVHLLVGVGEIGRRNIHEVGLRWDSRADWQMRWAEAGSAATLTTEAGTDAKMAEVVDDDPTLRLPRLYVQEVVCLLKQCRALRKLSLVFEKELLEQMPKGTFRADPGIQALGGIKHVEKVDICGLDNRPLEECELAQWLVAEMTAET